MRKPLALSLFLLLGFTVPAVGSVSPTTRLSLEARIVRAAKEHLRSPPRLTRRDCSGLVMSVLARAGLPYEGDSRTMWRDAVEDGRAYEVGVPAPGHLAFFDRTWDKNRNGLVDDELTHIAVVTDVLDDGRVVMVHRERGGVRTLRLDLSQPDVHHDGEALRNDFLRASHYGDDDDPRLSGQLLRGFARPPLPQSR